MRISDRLKKPFKVLMIALIVIFAFSTLMPRTKDMLTLYFKKRDLQVQISALEKRQSELQQEKAAMSSSGAIERIAREQLGMIKPGEKVLIEVASP